MYKQFEHVIYSKCLSTKPTQTVESDKEALALPLQPTSHVIL